MTVVLTLDNILLLTDTEVSQMSTKDLERLKKKLTGRIDTLTTLIGTSEGSTKDFWEKQKAQLLIIQQSVINHLS